VRTSGLGEFARPAFLYNPFVLNPAYLRRISFSYHIGRSPEFL